MGGPGGPLHQTQGYQIFRAVRPHHRADKYITIKKITARFSYMGPNVKKCAFLPILLIFGGSWGALTSNPGKKISTSFSYMGPNVKKFAFWAIRGALGGP